MARSEGLRTIFSVFLGLMLAAFFGVGAYTFYPPPDDFEREIREIGRGERAILESGGSAELSDADRQRLQELGQRRADLAEAEAEARVPWGRTTSIILVVLATLTMAVSLVRADQLQVISNGLLLGGVFTMLYGVGWIIATDASVTRFLVMSAALAITLGLGYARFVRHAAGAPPGVAAEPNAPGLADVERRLRDLEDRLSHAANALGAPRDGPDGR